MKPFIKWVGGKTQIIPHMVFPPAPRYVEPFVGGGAVLLRMNFKRAYVSDTNPDLINLYKDIRDHPSELIGELEELQQEDYTKTYYAHRDEFNNTSGLRKSALFIFLNKTCFNGLYRVSASGKFNVPMGRYKHPLICDTENILAVSKHLQHVSITCSSFEKSLKHVTADTFVYCDPPYRPVSATANFTSYTSEGFDDNAQIKLAEYARKVDEKGAKILLSNSDSPFFDDLYEGFHIKRVPAVRSVNSDGTKRGMINELLISNYDF